MSRFYYIHEAYNFNVLNRGLLPPNNSEIVQVFPFSTIFVFQISLKSFNNISTDFCRINLYE